MAYTINKTDGSIFASVKDGTINNDSSVTIIGKNYAGYGAFIGENFLRLLENGANDTIPTNPVTGELWFDKTEGLLKIFNGTLFKALGSVTSDLIEPTIVVTGDLWFDTANNQLNVYDGDGFLLVGPAFTGAEGKSGAIVEIIEDDNFTEHVVVKHYVAGELVAITSKDASFTALLPEPGFTGPISPGIQLSGEVLISGGVPLFRGTATNSELLDDRNSTQFMYSDADDTTSGTLGVVNNGGITVGTSSNLKMFVDAASNDAAVINHDILSKDIIFRILGNGTPTDVIKIDGVTLRAEVPGVPLTDLDITNKLYVDTEISDAISSTTDSELSRDGSDNITGVINPETNELIDFGETTKRFKNMYAKEYIGTTFTGTTFTGSTFSGKAADSGLLNAAADSITATNSTIVKRTGSGGIAVKGLDLNPGVTATAPSHFAVQLSSNNDVQWQTIANVKTNLGVTPNQLKDTIGEMVTSTNSETGITVSYQSATHDLDFALSTNYIKDQVGAMVGSNTESGMSVTYDAVNHNLDFVLTKDPTVTLSGAVDGTATMTNLGSINITTTIDDDSHNHTISNVDGLSGELSAKSSTSHTHALNDLTDVAGTPTVGQTLTYVQNGLSTNWAPQTVTVPTPTAVAMYRGLNAFLAIAATTGRTMQWDEPTGVGKTSLVSWSPNTTLASMTNAGEYNYVNIQYTLTMSTITAGCRGYAVMRKNNIDLPMWANQYVVENVGDDHIVTENLVSFVPGDTFSFHLGATQAATLAQWRSSVIFTFYKF